LYLGAIILLAAIVAYWYFSAFRRMPLREPFDGTRAMNDVQVQVNMGPRTPGSAGHAQVIAWMQSELEAAGWQPTIQQADALGHPIQNLIASRSSGPAAILVGAHYDTRLYASRDPDPAKRQQPVPGADDGASGVAVLLELARTLPNDTMPVSLVFFDAEDNGDIPGWDWILGSRAYVASLTAMPRAMILVDMVGADPLSLPLESNSDVALRSSIWQMAAKLGHGDVFIPSEKYSVEDDHMPFLQAGVPAVDIIDLDYPYWHTTADTPEHVSARSLQIVGDVLWNWLAQQKASGN
jgi:Zn-dependent M28 family amino/carboxypeptidase